jgi:hypothetical protein
MWSPGNSGLDQHQLKYDRTPPVQNRKRSKCQERSVVLWDIIGVVDPPEPFLSERINDFWANWLSKSEYWIIEDVQTMIILGRWYSQQWTERFHRSDLLLPYFSNTHQPMNELVSPDSFGFWSRWRLRSSYITTPDRVLGGFWIIKENDSFWSFVRLRGLLLL